MTAGHKFPIPTVSSDLTTSAGSCPARSRDVRIIDTPTPSLSSWGAGDRVDRLEAIAGAALSPARHDFGFEGQRSRSMRQC
jgi:hypothetical protein